MAIEFITGVVNNSTYADKIIQQIIPWEISSEYPALQHWNISNVGSCYVIADSVPTDTPSSQQIIEGGWNYDLTIENTAGMDTGDILPLFIIPLDSMNGMRYWCTWLYCTGEYHPAHNLFWSRSFNILSKITDTENPEDFVLSEHQLYNVYENNQMSITVQTGNAAVYIKHGLIGASLLTRNTDWETPVLNMEMVVYFDEVPGTYSAGTDLTIDLTTPAGYESLRSMTFRRAGSPTISINTNSFGVRFYYLFTELGLLAQYGEISPEAGEASGPGGYGGNGFDTTSDTIDGINANHMGYSSTGFVHVYNPTLQGLSGLGAELIPKLEFEPPTSITDSGNVATAIVNGFNNVATWLANIPSIVNNSLKIKMVDYIMDCHIIPVSPYTSGSEPIRVGWQDLEITAPKVSSDYVYFSCGSLLVKEFFENFADYLSNARLYIPFVGFVSLQPEWFNNVLLSLNYVFNVVDGSFVVELTGSPTINGHLKSHTLLGQWGGSCCVHLPITGVNYSAMMSGAIGGTAGAVTSAGTGNLAGVAESAINAASARGTVEQSNSYSASAAFLSCRTAFIQISRPVPSYSAKYAHEHGIPANITARLGSLNGFVKMENVHLDGIPCTDEERNKIAALLKSGVVV